MTTPEENTRHVGMRSAAVEADEEEANVASSQEENEERSIQASGLTDDEQGRKRWVK